MVCIVIIELMGRHMEGKLTQPGLVLATRRPANSGPHDVEDDDGRHGEHAGGADALDHAAADQGVGPGARGCHHGADEVEEHAGEEDVLAAEDVRDVREEQLEDGLGQEETGGYGEDAGVGGLEVFCYCLNLGGKLVVGPL